MKSWDVKRWEHPLVRQLHQSLQHAVSGIEARPERCLVQCLLLHRGEMYARSCVVILALQIDSEFASGRRLYAKRVQGLLPHCCQVSDI